MMIPDKGLQNWPEFQFVPTNTAAHPGIAICNPPDLLFSFLKLADRFSLQQSPIIGEAFEFSHMARFILTALVVLAVGAVSVRASDPELTTDFFVPEGKDVSMIDGSFFTFSGLRGDVSPAPAGEKFGVTKMFSSVFPALTGLGVAAALLEFIPMGMNPHHTHPRATELLYLISGNLNVGLIDTNNKLYEQNLTAGDLFVFPKGLVHYQVNLDYRMSATAIASFSGSSPGWMSIPSTVFGSMVKSSDILRKAFGVSSDVVMQLEAPFMMSL